jgi:Glycosyl hydrolase family 26
VNVRPSRARVLVSTVAVVLLVAGCSWAGSPSSQSGREVVQPPAPTGVTPIKASVATVLANRPLFGVTTVDRKAASIAKIAKEVGCRPTLSQAFVSVAEGMSVQTLQTLGGVPLLTVEPWHPGGGANQADFSLSHTIDGTWDKEYEEIARSIVEYHDAVLIRFAHEMNGHWYPWGVANGNRAGQYSSAFRHVVNLFRKAGATNALWVWSPNIVRGASSQTISQFWPGSKYVDIVGLTGYGVSEMSPDRTYDKTLHLVAGLTKDPILLTEMGAQHDSDKHSWITNFGPWLRDHPQIAGFVWTEDERQGDWGFDDTPANLAAFKKDLVTAGVAC